MKEKPETIKNITSLFNQLSPTFDSFAEVLQGKVYGYVTWKHLKNYLPESKKTLILDAGGGTGRWAVPLGKMGYRIVLCDISKGMLEQATNKISREGLSDKVKITEANLINLSFPDGMFDFVLCEDGPISISDSHKVVRELARVLKRGGKIWASVLGRYPFAFAEVDCHVQKALKLSRSEINYVPYKGIEKSRIFTPEELQELFQHHGFKAIKLYGNRIMIRLLPDEIQMMTDYNDKLFSELADLELYFSEEPALSGMAEYIQIVAKKGPI